MTHYLRNIFTSSALLVMFSATFALGASVSFTSSVSGAYLIMGNNMDGVAGIQLNVTYDAASLATPTVTLGGLVSGAMLAANTTQPGIIKIAIISTRAFSGSGQIATISFASKKGSGGIISITTDMIDSKGSAIASSSSNPSSETAATEFISTPGIPFSQSSAATTSSTASTTAAITATSAAATTSAYPGTIMLPTDLQKQTDLQPAPSSTVPAPSEEPAVSEIPEQTKPADKSASDSKLGETPQFVVYKGISERFELYKGSKSLPSIVTLFDKKIARNIHQEPAILLSDGQIKATLTVEISSKTGSSPNFAMNGGKLVSFRRDKQKNERWIIEVLPETGAIRTTIAIIAESEEFEFPLTVAPPVKTMLTLDEPGWNRFLKEVGTAQTPLHDLNNDGVRNYVDEFIFVANFLAKKTTPQKPVSTPNKSVK